jgi:hypothetical protein
MLYSSCQVQFFKFKIALNGIIFLLHLETSSASVMDLQTDMTLLVSNVVTKNILANNIIKYAVIS